MAEQKIGRVTHYWAKIGVAGIEITAGEIQVGDTIHFKGHTSRRGWTPCRWSTIQSRSRVPATRWV
jgi:hypothetical protein